MPDDFDIKAKAYRVDGKLISRTAVRAQIDVLLETVKGDAGKLAAKFDAGEITAVEFELAMRGLLSSAHIVAASVGRGGRALMTASDWGKVGSKIKWQYGYLAKFARKLASGALKAANTANRAKQYISAVYISYADTTQKAMTEFVAGGGDANPKGEMLCYLEQNSKEGCEECTADAAAGPMPVSEMGDLGTRICGDFCLCTIIFSDEPEYKP